MECPKREMTDVKHPIHENAPAEEGSKYPSGIPLFLNLLSIILATIVCGYVCIECQAVSFNFVLVTLK